MKNNKIEYFRTKKAKKTHNTNELLSRFILKSQLNNSNNSEDSSVSLSLNQIEEIDLGNFQNEKFPEKKL